MTPTHPPSVGSPDHVDIEFPLDHWSFTATFRPVNDRCGRMQTAPLTRTGPTSFTLTPVGRAARYNVTLFGRGNGDLSTTFRWTTPSDGPLPTPQARLAVLAATDGQVDSYGVELEVANLAARPRDSAAQITVTATNGASVTFPAELSLQNCLPEGTIYWDGPDDQGTAAAQLGPSPYTYVVELTLDGQSYVATARWPADVIRGNEPSVRLHFTPDLPALG